MVTIVFSISVLLYLLCIVILVYQWTPFSNGFKEDDGSYTSKYYQIACHVMRKAFMLLMIVMGYILYWIGDYSQLY